MKQSDIYDIFDSGGLLSKQFVGYEFREGQLEMSLIATDLYEHGGIGIIEAGTGIGKSFAYLVPAVLHALEHDDERTVVATATINLQKQLFDKDIVQLFSVMDKEVPVALLMGRNNYLCIRRLQELRDSMPLAVQDPDNPVAKLIWWSSKTETGIKADVTWRIGSELWQEVCSDVDSCFGGACAFAKDCFFLRARRKAAEANIIITNHHLLFTDARSRSDDDIPFTEEAVLPAYQRLVIDEAHNIERNATEFFTITYDSRDILRMLAKIARSRRYTKGAIELLSPFSQDNDIAGTVLGEISNFTEAIGLLDTWLVSFMQKQQTNALLIRSHMHPMLSDFSRLAREVAAYGQQLSEVLQRFVGQLTVAAELEHIVLTLEHQASRIEQSVVALVKFIDFDSWTNDVYWFEMINSASGQRTVSVHISPLQISSSLKEGLFSKLESVLCTSATLELGDDFLFWSSRVGLPLNDGRPFITAVYPSPFDFRNNLLLLTPSDAPAFLERNSEPFIAYCIQTIRTAIHSSQGGALVLFTSYGMLLAVSQALSADLTASGINVLRQGEGERSQLLREFLSDKDSVLFATDSFWEGVDAPGDTLRLVIITKLPFKVPSDPVFRARQEALDSTGESGFMRLALPEATMKLKQGFGRLLRNTLDTGVVLILDSRVVQKGYGAWMLKALPDSYHPDTLTDGISDKIETFLYSRNT
ncbi:MAG: helicase C-terminal domain-containing protein [Sphaerochaetaceae bacterium]|nr:ATP-dependent DNA helicase [Spirochaetales bacterium]